MNKILAYRLCNIYTYVTFVLFMILGSISINLSNSIENQSAAISPSVMQIIPDWQTVPFVEISVVTAGDGCPEGSEAVFSRSWAG